MTEAVKLDFAKMDGLLPAIVQDAVSGEVLMVGFMNDDKLRQNAGNRLCDILEPNAAKTMDEGRNQRKPLEGSVGCDRLRSGYGAFSRDCRRRWAGLPRGNRELLYPAIELPAAAKMEAANGSR